MVRWGWITTLRTSSIRRSQSLANGSLQVDRFPPSAISRSLLTLPRSKLKRHPDHPVAHGSASDCSRPDSLQCIPDGNLQKNQLGSQFLLRSGHTDTLLQVA